jgi:hypothetical protein
VRNHLTALRFAPPEVVSAIARAAMAGTMNGASVSASAAPLRGLHDDRQARAAPKASAIQWA